VGQLLPGHPPNWSVQLPCRPYDGADPDGFMPRETMVAYLERYAAAVDAPVVEGVQDTGLRPNTVGFDLEPSIGPLATRSVVVCTGAYQRSHRLAAAATLPAGLPRLDVEDYRSPAELPPGGVLIIGSAQSGCQIAEELQEASRRVFSSPADARAGRRGASATTTCGAARRLLVYPPGAGCGRSRSKRVRPRGAGRGAPDEEGRRCRSIMFHRPEPTGGGPGSAWCTPTSWT
jgi:hypothetical protein